MFGACSQRLGGLAMIIPQESTEPIAAPHQLLRLARGLVKREKQQHLFLALMVALLVVMDKVVLQGTSE